jgi:hypothetical protein
LGSSTKATASKHLEALCEEWYNNFVKASNQYILFLFHHLEVGMLESAKVK